MGIHPNFFLAALVDPRMKHFPPEISNADKEAVKAEMVAKMVKASPKDAPAAAPVAAVANTTQSDAMIHTRFACFRVTPFVLPLHAQRH